MSPRFPVALLALALVLHGGSAPAEGQDADAPEILSARAALAAEPLDCQAVEAAFAAIQRAGRLQGDIEMVVTARRLDVPCAVAAANTLAEKLPIPDPEIMKWLLSRPGSIQPAPPILTEGDGPEAGLPLDCGLLLTSRHIEFGTPVSRVVLSFRNSTTGDVAGHDIVVSINGQAWRSLALPRGEAPPDAPMGAASHLRWDGTTGSWEDQRMTEARTFRWSGKRRFMPLTDAVPPGGSFDIIVRVEGLTEGTQPEDLDVRFESCALK